MEPHVPGLPRDSPAAASGPAVLNEEPELQKRAEQPRRGHSLECGESRRWGMQTETWENPFEHILIPPQWQKVLSPG